MSNNIFEKATRTGLRFNGAKGLLTVEDLWNIKLTGTGLTLDSLAIEAHEALEAISKNTISFVDKTSNVDLSEPTLKLDILKHIIQVKVEERDKAISKANTKEKEQELLALLSEKQQDKRKALTEEELLAELAKLKQ